MTIIARNMGNLRITEHMRGALVGVYKSGKSWTLATAPDPVLIIDLDLRSDSLAGKYGVYCASIAEPPGLNMMPTAYSETLDLVARIERSRRLGDILPEFSNDPRADENIRTVGLDSVQSISRAMMQHIMYTGGKQVAREIKVSGQTFFFPNGWDTWNADTECMEQLVGRLVAIPEVDLWVTFHEDDPKDGKIALFPNRHRNLMRYFNEVWRMTRASAIPAAQLVPNSGFPATTTLQGVPDFVDNPNIKQLVAQYGRK